MPYAQDLDVDLILTTGVTRDLLNTGFVEQILEALPSIAYFPLQVYEDYRSRNVELNKRGLTDPDQDFLDNLLNLVDQDLLSLADLESDEEFRDFSTRTSDYRLPKQRFGAIVCVLAKHRNWIVACNDKKTINVLSTFKPEGRYAAGIDLIKNCAELGHIDQTDIHQILTRLQDVKIIPSNSHPHYLWWKNKMKQLEGN